MRSAAIDKQAYPTRGLRSEVDHCTNYDGGDGGASEHQSPSDVVFDAAKSNGNNITQRDAKRSPHLPLHDQGAANRSGGTLRRVDWGCGGFRTDTETKEETSDEELGPRVGERFPY